MLTGIENAPLAQNAVKKAGVTEGTAITSDFETFLRMLTTQMQNQNPLEPIEASDFAVQLATFSGVEQQVRTNELLMQLTTRLGLSELASWVGKSALSDAPVYLSDTPRKLVPPEVTGVDRAELILQDSAGVEVGRYRVDPMASELEFDPLTMAGPDFRPGNYTLKIESFQGPRSLGTNPVLSYARIEEARSDAGHVLLMLEGGHMIESSAVVGLRE